MSEPKRISKRNNYTLTAEAQLIIDNQLNKSRFVSEAIIEKHIEECRVTEFGNYAESVRPS